MKPSAVPDGMHLDDWDRLVLACGGQPPGRDGGGASFTGRLLELFQHADPRNKARLAMAYPREAAAFSLWVTRAPAITAGELRAAIDGIPEP